jgi:hypothetical protein
MSRSDSNTINTQDIRNFTNLLVSDAATVGPSASNTAAYDAAFANSTCPDLSYACALPVPFEFVTYSS